MHKIARKIVSVFIPLILAVTLLSFSSPTPAEASGSGSDVVCSAIYTGEDDLDTYYMMISETVSLTSYSGNSDYGSGKGCLGFHWVWPYPYNTTGYQFRNIGTCDDADEDQIIKAVCQSSSIDVIQFSDFTTVMTGGEVEGLYRNNWPWGADPIGVDAPWVKTVTKFSEA